MTLIEDAARSDTGERTCPLCESQNLASFSMCETCGYDFGRKQIGDSSTARANVRNWVYSPTIEWPDRVERVRRVHEIQVAKYGRRMWSHWNTAKLLGKGHGTVWQDLKLAQALQSYPKLRDCRNRSMAVARLKQIGGGVADEERLYHFTSEEELQKYMEKNWNSTPFGIEWRLEHGKLSTGEVGEIDLLARHRKAPRCLVIELKVGEAKDDAVGQILRYMGWVKEHLASANETVEGLIISESDSEQIQSALSGLGALIKTGRNIQLKLYASQGNRLELIDPIQRDIMELPENELKKLQELLELLSEKTSGEERARQQRVHDVMGKYAFISEGSDDFARRKQEEIVREG